MPNYYYVLTIFNSSCIVSNHKGLLQASFRHFGSLIGEYMLIWAYLRICDCCSPFWNRVTIYRFEGWKTFISSIHKSWKRFIAFSFEGLIDSRRSTTYLFKVLTDVSYNCSKQCSQYIISNKFSQNITINMFREYIISISFRQYIMINRFRQYVMSTRTSKSHT